IITGELSGPPNYRKRAIINALGSIADIAEKYKKGDYDAQIDDYATEAVAQDDEPGVPKRRGDGEGVRAERGRGGCPPDEQEETGKGSGTRGGRAAEEEDMYDTKSDESDESDAELVGAGSEKES
ncbi:unnamed protein product, partial [marine sediment metagenome]